MKGVLESMKGFLCFVVALALFAGCRLEDWREVSLPVPQGLTEAQVQVAFAKLDSQTPPEARFAGGFVTVRYNSLRVASKNFEYALEQLQREEKGRALSRTASH